MYQDRVEHYKKIEELTESKLLVYIGGDRPGLETQIHTEVLDFFSDHLDSFSLPKRISLLLYSKGGDTLASWNIVNLIKLFCDEFEVIVPAKARSAATLICLGAQKITMTKQATLGPIDPSINTPINPPVPGAAQNIRLPISVEAVAGYFDLAKEEVGIKRQPQLSTIFTQLAGQVHPIALGNVYRARAQIQMLAEKLLGQHMTRKRQIKKIVRMLCTESGSHDYTINRREALNELQLPVHKPSAELYKILNEVHKDIRKELLLNTRFDPKIELSSVPQKQLQLTRGLIESIPGGSHKFITRARLIRQMPPTPPGVPQQIQIAVPYQIISEIEYEGWEHESVN